MSYHYEMDESVLKREKAAARELRNSRWWQNKISSFPACHYCQKKLSREEATMDHIVPMVRGGRSTKGNIVVACKPCNNLKKDRLLMEWSSYMELTTSRAGAEASLDLSRENATDQQ